MAHVYADVTVRGTKGPVELEQVLVDSGATFTTLPSNLLEDIGAWGPLAEVPMELANGAPLPAKVYAVAITMKGVEAPGMAATFAGARPLVGVLTLETIGLKIDPVSGELEFTRPGGVAYLYSPRFVPRPPSST